MVLDKETTSFTRSVYCNCYSYSSTHICIAQWPFVNWTHLVLPAKVKKKNKGVRLVSNVSDYSTSSHGNVSDYSTSSHGNVSDYSTSSHGNVSDYSKSSHGNVSDYSSHVG